MFELVACEKTLLDEIANKDLKKIDVARTYAMAIKSSESRLVDWKKVNQAIMDRWGTGSLSWVKTVAWQFVDGKREFTRKVG